MATDTVKNPSGQEIKRNGATFKLSWKRGSDYTKQQVQYYNYKKKKWVSINNINPKATSASHKFSMSGTMHKVKFRVRGYYKKWSKWVPAEFVMSAPPKPTLTFVRTDLENSSTFSWKVKTDKTDNKPFDHIVWQAVLLKECTITNGKDVSFSSKPGNRYKSGYNKTKEKWPEKAEGSTNIVELTEDVLDGSSATRWVRCYAVGVGGKSDYAYAKIIYAKPKTVSMTSATLTRETNSAYTCKCEWNAKTSTPYPISKVTALYAITVPADGFSVPVDTTWTEASVSADTKKNDYAVFTIPSNIDEDNVVFVKINAHYSDRETEGTVRVATIDDKYGTLKDPSEVSTETVGAKIRINATNNSDVPNAHLAVVYEEPPNSYIIGIIPHGEDHVDIDAPSGTPLFGVYAFAGSYESVEQAGGGVGYTVSAKMRSAHTIWEGGAVPTAPDNVTVEPTATQGTVRVEWDWSWDEADSAVLGWADHADAWESTDEPDEYTVSRLHAPSWNISGLETGKTWYIAVKLMSGDTSSPWSTPIPIELTSAPVIPVLNATSYVVSEDSELTLYWSYMSIDGTAQSNASICEVLIDDRGNVTYEQYVPTEDTEVRSDVQKTYYNADHIAVTPQGNENPSAEGWLEYKINIIASAESEQQITVLPSGVRWKAGDTKHLCVAVTSESGRVTDWSDPITIEVADKIVASITDTSLIDKEEEDTPHVYQGDVISLDYDDVPPDVASLKVPIEPIQDLNGYDKPWSGGAGKNKLYIESTTTIGDVTQTLNSNGTIALSGTTTAIRNQRAVKFEGDASYMSLPVGRYRFVDTNPNGGTDYYYYVRVTGDSVWYESGKVFEIADTSNTVWINLYSKANVTLSGTHGLMILKESETDTSWTPYSNICPISGHTECETSVAGKNLAYQYYPYAVAIYNDGMVFLNNTAGSTFAFRCVKGVQYNFSCSGSTNRSVWAFFEDEPQAGTIATGSWTSEYFNGIATCTAPLTGWGLLYVKNSADPTLSDSLQIELGATATPYEPYTATTHHTDFEGYYTTTSEDAMPYTKRIAELDGDRLREKIVGGTVAWNQWARSFVKRENVLGVTITPNNTAGSITVTGTATSTNNLYFQNNLNIVNNHVYVISGAKTHGIKVSIYTQTDTGNGAMFKATADSVNVQFTYKFNSGDVLNETIYPQIFDLTQMFGSTIADYIYSLEQANAGDGVAWFKSLFPNDYYEYNAGELKSVENVSAHRTGKNLLKTNDNLSWIPSLTKNADGSIKVVGSRTANGAYAIGTVSLKANKTYVMKASGSADLYFQMLNASSSAVAVAGLNDGTYTPTSDETVTIRVFARANISFDTVLYPQLELGSTATDYEPYGANTYPLDSSLTLRGIPKLDSSNQLYYDGDTYEADGTVTRKYGIVDLGTLNWGKSSTSTDNYWFTAPLTGVKNPTYTTVGNLQCSIYNAVSASSGYTGTSGVSIHNSAKQVQITDSSKNDMTGAQFKTAMSGVMLVYELATPTTESAEPYTEIQKVVSGGIEEYVTDSIVPVGHQTEYLNRAIFGGTLDVVSGVLTVTHAAVDMGSLAWAYESTVSNTHFRASMRTLGGKYQGDLISTMFVQNPQHKVWSVLTNYEMCMDNSVATPILCLKDDDYTDAAAFKTAVTGQTLVYELAEPQTIQLTPYEVELLTGHNNVYSDGPIELRTNLGILQYKALDRLPLRITTSGAGEGGETTIVVERRDAYHVDRPDESEFNGFKGETIATSTFSGDGSVEYNVTDLIGSFDDTAQYVIIATVKDTYGQTDTAEIPFDVEWDHQASAPKSATVEIDEEYLIAKLTAVAPDDALASDVVDIYRLSADKPELVVSGGQFGTMYVDPYPAINGEYRFVTRTADGDYISPDATPAWIDVDNEWDYDHSIIDFDGQQVLLYYNLDLSNNWEKSFHATRYLGGSIKGDWDAGVLRTATLSTVAFTEYDADVIDGLRDLAEYEGICHIRTLDGSSFSADLQVQEDRDHEDYGTKASFSIQGTRVDPEEEDGLTYEEWHVNELE